jgi:predicted transcriptional regulator
LKKIERKEFFYKCFSKVLKTPGNTKVFFSKSFLSITLRAKTFIRKKFERRSPELASAH